MQLDEIVFDGPTPIDSYGPGFFRVDGAVYHGPLAVLPGGILPWDGLADAQPFLAIADQIDVLLVGTGAEITAIPTAFQSTLEEAGIGVERMATPMACRSYNVLLAEGRRVGAALLTV